MQHESLQTFDDIGRMIPGGIHTEIKYRAAVKGAGERAGQAARNMDNFSLTFFIGWCQSILVLDCVQFFPVHSGTLCLMEPSGNMFFAETPAFPRQFKEIEIRVPIWSSLPVSAAEAATSASFK